MSDYQRIAQAIEFIENQAEKQPTLDDIASHLNLSPYHFQRLFSRWAGISPKRFLQSVTLKRAKSLLRAEEMSTLNAAYELGLSSSSRLYEHFIQLEAVTPSEFKAQGKGLTFTYGFHDTPFGQAAIALTSRGVSHLAFEFQDNFETWLADIKKDWQEAHFIQDENKTLESIECIFKTHSQKKPLSLWVKGTNFQIQTWQALLKIPQGKITSYGGLAKVMGREKSSRAVGNAIGSNPVAFLIPCHRVLRQSGELGGYRWGTQRKQAILAWEENQIIVS